MSGFIVKWLGNKLIQEKILKERLENRFGVEDPYFEQVPASRLDGGRTGRVKKIRKAVPPGISDHDAEVLNKVKRRAYRLDMAFGSICGVKLGWGSLIAIFPVIGDFADTLLGLLVINTAKQVEGGLPFNLRLSMYFWLLVDLLIGLVPFVGDVADALVLANTRNAAALEAHLREKGRKNLRSSGLPIPASDPSDPAEFDRLQSGSPGTSRLPLDDGPSQSQHTPHTSGVTSGQSEPAPARVHDNQRGRSSRGLFSFGSKKSKLTDVEAGIAAGNRSR
ncbi:hypothetical protein GGR50DRAFT_692016 [Xylaria sp. CBS 124048]|nr:hypothetical protein GGR50DRAFT_692016 [Xylaria sp. CBS 124048]